MIDIGKILGRAWHVVWNYKVLWIFGILVVLMGGGGAGPNFRASWNNNGYNGPYGYQGGQTPENLPAFMQQTNHWFDTVAQPWFERNIQPWFASPEAIVRTVIWMVVIILVLSLLLKVLTSLVLYPAQTAMVRMVDEYEQTGTKKRFGEGWKLGWSKAAFRLWVIDLIIGLPAFILALIALSLGLTIASSAIRGNWAMAGGTIFALAVTMIALVLAVVLVSVFLNLLRPFIARKTVLEELAIGDSFRQGWAMFKGNWQSAGLMWLVMIGLWIGFGLVMILVSIILIPALILTAVAGLIVAAIPYWLAFWIMSLTSIAPIAWILAIIPAMLFFLPVFLSPFLLIGAWVDVFQSSVWTLTYREIKVLENLKPAPAAPAKA
jgi:hypothetical protein